MPSYRRAPARVLLPCSAEVRGRCEVLRLLPLLFGVILSEALFAERRISPRRNRTSEVSRAHQRRILPSDNHPSKLLSQARLPRCSVSAPSASTEGIPPPVKDEYGWRLPSHKNRRLRGGGCRSLPCRPPVQATAPAPPAQSDRILDAGPPISLTCSPHPTRKFITVSWATSGYVARPRRRRSRHRQQPVELDVLDHWRKRELPAIREFQCR